MCRLSLVFSLLWLVAHTASAQTPAPVGYRLYCPQEAAPWGRLSISPVGKAPVPGAEGKRACFRDPDLTVHKPKEVPRAPDGEPLVLDATGQALPPSYLTLKPLAIKGRTRKPRLDWRRATLALPRADEPVTTAPIQELFRQIPDL